MSVIEVNHITKEYRLGYLTSFKDNLRGMLARLRGQHPPERKLFKALDDIDFNVMQGEVVGIIGPNGAGKSTLLKILANVVQPTSGKIHVEGKIAPLIEVGAGLVGDLTGRENVFLNSSILGIPRSVIKKKMDEIISFAELEEFIDTPIKRYSSGMKVRLGFSIATSIDADVLIVDEVLAVGDLAFQRKCFSRMEDLIKHRGSTVLLVSHNIRQIERMCSRVILLDQGHVLADSHPSEVCELFYERSNTKVRESQESISKARIQSTGEFELISVNVVDQSGVKITSVQSGATLRVKIKFRINTGIPKPEIVVGTHTTDFVYLTTNTTALFPERPDFQVGTHEIEYMVEQLPLAAGVYCIRLVVFDENGRKVFAGEMLETFLVTERVRIHEANWRMLNIPAMWKLDGKKYIEQIERSKERLLECND
jgi:ABC-type polysaccharide/polyol phosphate transport system ATPase subunit